MSLGQWLPLALFLVLWVALNAVQMVYNHRYLKALQSERLAMRAMHDQIEAQLHRLRL
jgi:hypothetical protein